MKHLAKFIAGIIFFIRKRALLLLALLQLLIIGAISREGILKSLASFISADGTTENGWAVAGATGPQILNDGGVIEARNATGASLVNVRGATPTVAQDLTTKSYVDNTLQGLTLTDAAPGLGNLISWDGGAYGPTNAPQQLATVSFAQELNTGDAGPSDAAAPFVINWTAAQWQEIFLTGNATVSFTAPPGPCHVQMRLIQSGAGSNLVTWPASVKWYNSVPPTLSTAINAVDICSWWYNGTNYYGVCSLNFG